MSGFDELTPRGKLTERIGPGGIPAVAVLGLIGALKAAALVAIAEALARGIVAAIAADAEGLRDALILGVAAAFVRAGVTWASRWFSTRAAIGAKESIRRDVASSVLAGGGGTVGSTTAVAALGLDELDEYYRTVLPAAVTAATVPLIIGARILFADWVSALIIVLTIPLVPVFMILVGQHSKAQADEASGTLQRLSDHLVELGRGLPVLVGLGRLNDQAAALDRIGVQHKQTTMRTLRTAFLSSLVLELISTISVAVVAVFVGVRLIDGSLPLTIGLVALILAPECFQPFRELGSAFHASQDGLAALRRSQQIVADTPATRVVVPGGALRVTNLTVRYPGRAPVVEGLNLQFGAGRITALTGASGSGKSTVLGVLAGTVTPAAGTVGGIDPALLAWVPQHPHTVGATVRDELALYAGAASAASGVPHAGSKRSTSQIRAEVGRFSVPTPAFGTSVEAAAAVDDVLAELGLERVASADPARLSPGELRRIAVARGLLRVRAGATVLLLDEPTAHLDAVSSARVVAALRALKGSDVTIVLASHEQELLDLADDTVMVGRQGGGRAAASAAPESTVPHAGSKRSTSQIFTELGPGSGPTPACGTRLRDAAAELWAFVRPSWWRLAAAILIGAAAALFAASLTAVSGWLIVRAADQPPIMYLLVAIVGVRFFGIGRAALRYAERLLTHNAVFTSLIDLRSRVWAGLADRGLSARALATGSAALDYLIAAADKVRDLTPRVLVPVGSAIVTAAAALIAFGIFLPSSVPVLLTAVLVSLGVAPTVALIADRSAARAAVTSRSRMVREFSAVSTAAADLRANGIADRALGRLEALDAAAGRAARRGAWALGLGDAIAAFSCVVAAVMVLPTASAAVTAGVLDPPIVAVLALLPLGLIEPLGGAVGAIQQSPALASALLKVRNVTPAPDAPHPHPAPRGSLCPRALDRGIETLELEGVAARWPGASVDAFGPLNAVVERGQWLVVEGPSGSGKSTLLATLLGYLPVASGALLVGGVDASLLPKDAVRERIVWCPQESHLFSSSIRGNLMLARPSDDAPTDDELVAAVTSVGLGPLLATLPDGLDSWVGPSGSLLSGGERQRLAVARALVARGDVVLLDEPTAHLDAQAAASLMNDLRSALADRIVVLVTHHADEVTPGDVRLRLGELARAS